MNKTPFLNRERLIQAFFFASFGFLLYQLFKLANPFMPGLLGGGMLALTFHPFYTWVQRYVKNRNITAFILTIGVIIVAVIPIIWTLFVFHSEIHRFTPTLQSYVEAVKSGDFQTLHDHMPPIFQNIFLKLSDYLNNLGIDLEQIVINQIRTIGGVLISWGAFTAKHFLMWILNGIVLIISMYFAFRDGTTLVEWVLKLIPMQADHKAAVAKRAYDTFRAVSVGIGVTALFQGGMAMIGFWIAGVKLPVLFGLATTFCSLLGGAFIITLPVAISVLAHNTAMGIFLLFWGMVMVGMLDNILRPILIGTKARLPFFVILFSIVGGIKAYGLLGVILGPVLVASLLTFIKIYREEYGQ